MVIFAGDTAHEQIVLGIDFATSYAGISVFFLQMSRMKREKKVEGIGSWY